MRVLGCLVCLLLLASCGWGGGSSSSLMGVVASDKRALPGRGIDPARRASTLDPGGGAVCEAALAHRVTFEQAGALREGVCGAPRTLSVTAVGEVALSAPARLRCPTAAALEGWVREVVQPAARRHLRADVEGLTVAASYSCRRRRNGKRGRTRWSEHAFANAIDISAVTLSNGRRVEIGRHRPLSGARAFQKMIRAGACDHFMTVIGPRTTRMHGDHLHLDLAPRKNGSRYCR